MAKKKNAVRKDGRIPVQVYLGRDENNTRKYKTVYGKTQKEADEKALQVKLSLRKGLDVTSEYDAFGEWADRWLKLKKAEVSLGQLNACESAVKHLKGSLGDRPISKLRASDVQDVLSDLAAENPHTGKPSAVKTLKSIKSVASQIFQLAIENRILEYNPAAAVKIPKSAEPFQRRALTREEQGWVEGLTHRAQCAAMIMMHAGLRRGELIPLTWADINLASRTITVNKAVEVINGKFVVKSSAKNEYSLRVIDIPNKLVEFLKNEPRQDMLVCTNSKGHMHTESSWERMWESYLQDMNMGYGDFRFTRKESGKDFKSKFDPEGVPFVIPRFTPHWLRHTFATNLYLAGVDILTAKEQLGHSNVKTTLEVYTHLDSIYKRRSMDKLDTYLEGCKSNASHENRETQ